MCYFKKRTEFSSIISDKDITVYKVIEYASLNSKTFKSNYRAFTYVFGKKYKTKLINYIYQQGIDFGFHSYSDVKYINYKYSSLLIKPRVIARKFNGQSINDIIYLQGLIIECVIPKGSQYYFNGCDYVSNSIKPICLILPEDEIYNNFPQSVKDKINTNFKITTHKI